MEKKAPKSRMICVMCKHFVRYYSMKYEPLEITYILENFGHCVGPWEKRKYRHAISISKQGCEYWEERELKKL